MDSEDRNLYSFCIYFSAHEVIIIQKLFFKVEEICKHDDVMIALIWSGTASS